MSMLLTCPCENSLQCVFRSQDAEPGGCILQHSFHISRYLPSVKWRWNMQSLNVGNYAASNYWTFRDCTFHSIPHLIILVPVYYQRCNEHWNVHHLNLVVCRFIGRKNCRFWASMLEILEKKNSIHSGTPVIFQTINLGGPKFERWLKLRIFCILSL